MARKTVILHSEWDCFLNRLNNEELGQWLRSVLTLMETDEEPQNLSRPVEMAFYAAYERIQRDWESFDRRSQNLRQNAPKPPQKKCPEKPKAAQKPRTPAPTKASKTTAESPDPAAQNPAEAPPESPLSQDSPSPPAGRQAPAALCHKTPPENPPAAAPDAELLALYSSHFGPPGPFACAGLGKAQQQLGLGLTRAIVEKAISNGARQWAYLQTSFDAARRQGLHSVEEYRLSHLRASGRIVDRPSPGKSDLLTRAVQPLGTRLNHC